VHVFLAANPALGVVYSSALTLCLINAYREEYNPFAFYFLAMES
jgi:hypothetical protein